MVGVGYLALQIYRHQSHWRDSGGHELICIISCRNYGGNDFFIACKIVAKLYKVTSEKLDEIVQVIESFFNKKTTLQTANKVITTTGRSIVRSGELEFEKGEIFIVLTDDGPWLNVQSEQTGEIGLIPENYCVPVNSITAMPWYCVGDRELSEKLLHNDGRDGAFVVRPSAASASGDKVKPFVLSLHRDGHTFHYAVMKAGNMFHLETLPNMFDSMSELVEFYKHHPITKIKPSRHEIEILTGRKFTGKRSSFLGVEGKNAKNI